MTSYLVTTATIDDIPQLVVIGHYDSCYQDHVAKYQRISYCFERSTRVAKACNIAIINYDSPSMFSLMQLLKSNSFSTFGLNLSTINLHIEYPEVFL